MARIAVFEKDPLVALDIAKTLKISGHQILGPFYNLPSADFPSALDGDFQEYDLAIVDFEFSKTLQLPTQTPVLLLTALTDDATQSSFKSVNSFGLLVKPFSAQELKSTVDIALYRSSMEKRLAESEQRYREFFDFSITARCIMDFDGKIDVTNKAFRALFGLDEGANLKSAIKDDETAESLCGKIRIGKQIERIELAMVSRSGLGLHVVGAFSIISLPGATQSEHGIQRISAEFYDETEPRRLREDLQQAQKMESLGRLAGGIAHDFNNILTAILGHAEMLKLEIQADSPLVEDVRGILDATDRARRLTQQLLSFSRKQPFSPSPCDMGQIVRDSVKLLKRLVGEDILLSVYVAENELPVFVDPMQIEQVLINLVANARDALEGRNNPRITLVAERRHLEASRRLKGTELRAGDYATIEVTDNGIGMSPEVASQAFEPYFTTKLMGKGSGLGLAIVASVATTLSGAVELQTAVSKGTSITLWIPLLDSRPATLERPLSASGTSAESLKKSAVASGLRLEDSPSILVVDDDEALLGFLATALSKAGADVAAARNGGEALLLTETRTFDSFVIDVNLPGVSGLNLYERLPLESKKHCIFITGRLDSDSRLPEGARLLQKPFTPQALVEAINLQLK
ncbi:MAG TPA: response regulator [Spirochaetales bacterium]|nr:response regulator [Spirochaetales bacterium]